MTKGTTSFGGRGRKKVHIMCRRCGKRTFHLRNKRCSSCGFGASPKLRDYRWMTA
ncbi:MAG: 50S ribosomal protein L37e [Thaumarchaeota archaeon]|nr:50S ribosomal protein L37e [Nitrososphaerota archaeon]